MSMKCPDRPRSRPRRHPAHQTAVIAVLALVSGGCRDDFTGVPPAGSIDLASGWAVASPASVGLDPMALAQAGENADQIDRARSLLVIREGKLVYERYFRGAGPDVPADVRSVTKSVVSILAGIALRRGDLESLDDPITKYLPDDVFAVRPEHAQVTLRDLLTMAGGFAWDESAPTSYNDWATSLDPVTYLLDRPFESTPGSDFTYNSAGVHLLGAVLEQATGMTLPAFADLTLFRPLGIGTREWEPLSGGRVNGGSGIDLLPRDLARIGQLLLQEGWSGTNSVVPPDYVADVVSGHWSRLGSFGPVRRVGYGYLWWLDVERQAYFAWGYGGQFIYVVPDLEMVVVATTLWQGVSEDIGSSALARAMLSVIVDDVVGAATPSNP